MKNRIQLGRAQKSTIYMLIGLIFNLAMALAKFYVGYSSGSLTIVIDSINNFIDVVFNVIATIAFVIIAFKPSKEVPQGYGRTEYLASFILSLLVVFSGVYFLFRSIRNIIVPTSLFYQWQYMIILVVSIIAKIGMGFLFAYANKEIKSNVFKGVIIDSFIDSAITTLAILGFYFSQYRLVVDSVFGIIISTAFIFVGIKLFSISFKHIIGKDTLDDDKKNKISKFISDRDFVKEIKSLIYHDYGFGKIQLVIKLDVLSNDDTDIKLCTLKSDIKKEFNLEVYIDTTRD